MNVIRKRLLAIIENYGNAMEEYGKLSSIGFILEAHKKLIETEKIEKESNQSLQVYVFAMQIK